jgi:anti-sigma factor ChrR (cupin superfamily)
LPSHNLPNGTEVSSFLDTSDWPTIAFGLKQKRLVLGEENDPTRPILILTHFPPGAVLPRHYHGDTFVDAVVQGTSNMEGETHEAGTVRVFPPKAMYGPITAGDDGCVLLEFYVDGPGFQTTIDQDALTDDMKVELARLRGGADAPPA